MAAGDRARTVRELPTTAAKIRALAARGESRADIARALGIRYQHVRNVLVRDEAKAKAVESSDPTIMPGKIRIGPDGSAIVPAKVIDTLALKNGDVLFVRIHDGEIHLLTKTAVMRRVQSLVREFVPEGV